MVIYSITVLESSWLFWWGVAELENTELQRPAMWMLCWDQSKTSPQVSGHGAPPHWLHRRELWECLIFSILSKTLRLHFQPHRALFLFLLCINKVADHAELSLPPHQRGLVSLGHNFSFSMCLDFFLVAHHPHSWSHWLCDYSNSLQLSNFFFICSDSSDFFKQEHLFCTVVSRLTVHGGTAKGCGVLFLPLLPLLLASDLWASHFFWKPMLQLNLFHKRFVPVPSC